MSVVGSMDVDELGGASLASAPAVGFEQALPDGFEDEAWETLRGCVHAVFAGQAFPGGLSREQVYQLVEGLCLHGCAPQLCSRLISECSALTDGRLRSLAAGLTEELLLERVAVAWAGHSTTMRQLEVLFLYLDRSHLLRHGAALTVSGPRSIWQCGLLLFRSALEALPGVLDRAIYSALLLVDADRQHRPLRYYADLGSFVGMLSQLGLYEAAFEPRLLERTTSFYRAEGEALLRKLPVASYLQHCDARVEHERTFCDTHLQASTAEALVERVRAELVKRHSGDILLSGFGLLVEGHCVADLTRAFRLLGDVGETQAVRAAWTRVIKSMGAKIMEGENTPEGAKSIIPAVIDLHKKAHEVLASSFGGCCEFARSLKDAFEAFLNAGVQMSVAKLLAKHLDEALEKTSGDPQHFETSIGSIIAVFRHLLAKDAFEAFFRKDLAKRLLSQRSASDDAEGFLLQSLRGECGAGYTSRMEGMLRDLRQSRALLDDFASEPDAKAAMDETGVDLDVLVVTTGFWPPQPPASPEIQYPPPIRMLQDMFSAFYVARHAGRSLKWSPSGGLCTLRMCVGVEARKELVVSALQALVLLRFNTCDRLTVEAICQATGIDTADLHRTLQSLALHKTIKVLLKESKGREILPEDVFLVNSSFSHKHYRIVVPQISAKDPQEEEALTEQRLFEDRQHEVDAVIVRTMKAAKILSHQRLVSDVFSAVAFPIQASDVKKRIESLIEREYLERDAKKPATYKYLA
eukprot:CAMPEP_0176070262 /NCGR_PEP_ID=MMETSP0120_2-20121206/35086_1 /TAXON_ID=160619 /ORGANISM="Kryptoperidinium foliaceum, Strain CCMP 1326" /LENGTH=749 /DNA_ID=CAMNT_0017403905 /DNA_START=42 /DNA_END=2291 /DNA_ORIENTATION=+